MDASIPTKLLFFLRLKLLYIYPHNSNFFFHICNRYILTRQTEKQGIPRRSKTGYITIYYGEQEYGGIWGDGCSSSQPSEEDQARIGENHWLVAGKAGDETCAERDHHDDDQAALSLSFGDFPQAHLCWGFLGERGRETALDFWELSERVWGYDGLYICLIFLELRNRGFCSVIDILFFLSWILPCSLCI